MKSITMFRWTINRAGIEFGLSPKTVASRVKAAGILPGKDGRFSTADVHRAICGDYERARTRKMEEEALHATLENQKAKGALVDVADFRARYERTYLGVRSVIMNSGLSDTDKDRILNDLAKLHSG
jgi:hypothetical protein